MGGVFEFIKIFLEGVLISLRNPYLIIIVIFYVLLNRYYPNIRGYMGEFWVKKELKKLNKEKYIILNDIMIESKFGKHQIDHIVVSEFGIFVIEMKNFHGIILGEDYDDKWIQYSGRNKNYFRNPIKQNYSHVKALEQILNLESSFFIPVICFSNEARLKIKSKNIIVQVDDLVKTIKKFYKPLVDKNIKEIAITIRNNNITDKKSRKKHIKEIKEKINIKQEKNEIMKCPKCGSQLVLRNSKYGTFIGCSSYPKCTYIKK